MNASDPEAAPSTHSIAIRQDPADVDRIEAGSQIEISPATARWPAVLASMRGERTANITIVLTLLGAAALLISQVQRLYFFGDDWEFLLKRRLNHDTWHTLFAPHNEHWSTLPIIVFRALFTVFGLVSYTPYGVTAVLVHLLVCIALWSVLRAVGTPPWITAVAIAVMAFLGAGAENTLWDFQIGFMGSVLFGLLAVRVACADSGGRGRLMAIWALLIASLMCSGVGIPLTIFCTSYLALARGYRRAATGASVPLIAYLVWYFAIGRVGVATDSTSLRQYGHIPGYIWTGIASVWGTILGVAAAGFVVFVVLALVPFLDPRPRPLTPVAIAGVVATVLQYALTSLTRVRFGIDQASSSRYVYIAAALTLPALALVLVMLSERVRHHEVAAGALLAVVVLLILAQGVALTVRFAESQALINQTRAPRIRGAEVIVASGQQILSPNVDPVYTPDITTTALARPDVRRAFEGVKATPQGLLDAESFIQVGVSTNRFTVGAATDFHPAGIVSVPTGNGCSVLTNAVPNPYVDIPITARGAMVTMRTTAGSAQLNTTLVRDGQQSAPASWKINPGQVTYVATSVDSGILRVFLTGHTPMTLCLP